MRCSTVALWPSQSMLMGGWAGDYVRLATACLQPLLHCQRWVVGATAPSCPSHPKSRPHSNPASRMLWAPSADTLYPSDLGRGLSISRKIYKGTNHLVAVIGWGPGKVSHQPVAPAICKTVYCPSLLPQPFASLSVAPACCPSMTAAFAQSEWPRTAPPN